MVNKLMFNESNHKSTMYNLQSPIYNALPYIGEMNNAMHVSLIFKME